MTGDTLMIYAPVPLFRSPAGALMLEDQACNGLRLWARHFGRVIAVMPLDPGKPPPQWRELTPALGADAARIEIVTLPQAWRPDRFLRALPAGRRVLRDCIARADYLSLAIGGLFGDWGAVACDEAFRMGRPHAVWTDRVESEVVRRSATTASHWRARLRARLTWRAMARLERRVLGRATVGLFHGRETFDHYAPHVRAAEMVHDIHLTRADHISPADLARKQAEAEGGPLRILYAGRIDAMKGPLDWVAALERLQAMGVEFTARWLGDGPERIAMQGRITAAGLQDRVVLPGMIADRVAVFAELRAAQVLMFCHKTPESPRILIESLVSGTPILGYEGAFARDLVAGHGGGRLVPLGDVAALTDSLTALARDRGALAGLIGAAAQDGAPFEDAEVFRHRSELIRHYLTPALSVSAG